MGELTAIDTHETRQIIKQLETSKAYETLGVWLAADGNHSEELKILKSLAKEWADQIRVSFLSKSEAARALSATIIKKLEYPLLAMNLTRDECDKILQPLLRASLPKARINRNFNRKVLRAPGGLLGLEAPCLYTTQVIEHVDCLIRHGGTTTFTGQLLDGTIEAAKVEIGAAGPLFTNSFDFYSHLLTKTWIKGVWNEIWENKLTVKEKTTSLFLKRDNDVFLNETFLSKGYSKKKLHILNICRLYLQVSTLSDITSGDGYYLLEHIFDKYNPLQQYSSIRWPNQGCPSDGEWTKWRYAICQCFPTNHQGRLLEPLGKWYKIDPKWGSFFDSRTSKLYVKAERWMQFQPNTQDFSGNNPQYVFSDYQAPPKDCTHVAVASFDTMGNLQTRGKEKNGDRSNRRPINTGHRSGNQKAVKRSNELSHAPFEIGKRMPSLMDLTRRKDLQDTVLPIFNKIQSEEHVAYLEHGTCRVHTKVN